MKRAAFKVQPAKGGWIRTTIAPINDKQTIPFRPMDIVMLMALVAGIAAIARLYLAR
jgi:hypothetical protein